MNRQITPGDGERQTGQYEPCLRLSAHREIQQPDDEDERQRDDVAQPRFHLLEELILARPLEAYPAGSFN